MSELPTITDEDRLVAIEAYELWGKLPSADCRKAPEIAAALVRTGWKPVDPDLLLAREVVAKDCEAEGRADLALDTLDGARDHEGDVRVALAAIKAAVARERGG